MATNTNPTTASTSPPPRMMLYPVIHGPLTDVSKCTVANGFAVPPEILDNSPLSLDLPVGHFFSELPKLVLTEMSAHPPDPASNVITDAFSSPSVGFVSRTLVTLSLSFQNTVR